MIKPASKEQLEKYREPKNKRMYWLKYDKDINLSKPQKLTDTLDLKIGMKILCIDPNKAIAYFGKVFTVTGLPYINDHLKVTFDVEKTDIIVKSPKYIITK